MSKVWKLRIGLSPALGETLAPWSLQGCSGEGCGPGAAHTGQQQQDQELPVELRMENSLSGTGDPWAEGAAVPKTLLPAHSTPRLQQDPAVISLCTDAEMTLLSHIPLPPGSHW